MNRLALTLIVTFAGALQAAEPVTWNRAEAAKYLDGRSKTWFEFGSANRGEGATKISCLSCHTAMPFALARHALNENREPSQYEKRLLEQTKSRVENWANIDTPAFKLYYDSDEKKKKESWGTESVMNALLLATASRNRGETSPDVAMKAAFANLWQYQIAEGDQHGSWNWLNFGLEPWEAPNGRYHGACLAAIAVGSAPGYYKPGADGATDARVKSLSDYLKGSLPKQNLFNQAWALWASTSLDGILTAEQKKEIVAKLFDKQREDGGWNLPSLGTFKRHDGTPEDEASDGYATGLVLHVLQLAGTPKNDPKIEKGLGWLRTHQEPTGEWRTASLNKKRDPASHVGKFMTDAATAYAVLALSH